jgi:hypothetical protein
MELVVKFLKKFFSLEKKKNTKKNTKIGDAIGKLNYSISEDYS